jgi:hypothetical protein
MASNDRGDHSLTPYTVIVASTECSDCCGSNVQATACQKIDRAWERSQNMDLPTWEKQQAQEELESWDRTDIDHPVFISLGEPVCPSCLGHDLVCEEHESLRVLNDPEWGNPIEEMRSVVPPEEWSQLSAAVQAAITERYESAKRGMARDPGWSLKDALPREAWRRLYAEVEQDNATLFSRLRTS